MCSDYLIWNKNYLDARLVIYRFKFCAFFSERKKYVDILKITFIVPVV